MLKQSIHIAETVPNKAVRLPVDGSGIQLFAAGENLSPDSVALELTKLEKAKVFINVKAQIVGQAGGEPS